MSLVATAILVRWLHQWMDAMLHNCSCCLQISDIEEVQKVQVTIQQVQMSQRRIWILFSQRWEMKTRYRCVLQSPMERTPFMVTFKRLHLRRQKMHFKRMCYLCNPVIQHSNVRMITMPYSHMPLSFDDLFSQSYALLIILYSFRQLE